MPNAGRFDHLLMNALALQLDLPRAPVLLLGPARRNVPLWEAMVRSEREGRSRTLLAPVSILWGRRPDRIRRMPTDVLWGDTANPRLLRKIWICLRHPSDIRIRVGRPVDIAGFLEDRPLPDGLAAKKLRRLLQSVLYRERKLVNGPPLRDRRRIIRAILRDPELRPIVAGVARREKKPEEVVWRRARAMLDEMVSDYDERMVAFSYRAFKWLWSRLFDGLYVDLEGLARVKEVSKDHPTILVPCHKSHMDYMLLCAIFYENDMMTPHIAAGANLAFWPIGTIFRKNGAFFIRRNGSGNLLYARLLYLYLRWLIRTGYSQEFFIEGGRTRTGKLVFPKHGLLSLQVDAFLDGASKDLYVIPIAVTYEKVPEDASYQAELEGIPKAKETFWSVWRARRLLRRSHGAGYVRFGEPISLARYFDVREGKPIPTRERKARTLALAHDLTRRIAEKTGVTASALVASALLACGEKAIPESVLRRRLTVLRDHLLALGAFVSPQARDPETNLPALLRFFESNQWLTIEPSGPIDRLVLVAGDRRISIDFYKNTALHYFLPAAIAAASDGPEGASFLRGILAHEFFLDEAAQSGTFPPEDRALFAGLIGNYLEAYDLVARAVLEKGLSKFPPGPGTVRDVLAFGRDLFASGGIRRPEAVTSENVKSAYGFFHERNLLGDAAELARWRSRLPRV
jgi:glycerol-3-phosphate O-acyltransferase